MDVGGMWPISHLRLTHLRSFPGEAAGHEQGERRKCEYRCDP